MKPIRNHSRNSAGLFFVLAALFCLFFFASGCSSKGVARTTATKRAEISFQKIAVIPFQVIAPEDPSSHTVKSPLSGMMARSCHSVDNAAGVVEELFLERLTAYRNLTVIPTDKSGAIYQRTAAESFKMRPLDVLRKVGRELEADVVAAGYVSCYRERKGYAYGADKTASVAFEISLFRASDGAVVWSSYFDKTQAPLSENLLEIATFIRAGFKWVTVKELSAEGIDKMMETFPISH